MTLRSFTDASGTAWDVWPVHPHTSGSYPLYEGPRSARGQRASAPLSPADGWLCFQSRGGERRRLMPIPDGWATAPDETLAQLCQAAVVLPAQNAS